MRRKYRSKSRVSLSGFVLVLVALASSCLIFPSVSQEQEEVGHRHTETLSEKHKPLIVPHTLESVVGSWSENFTLVFNPLHECAVVFKEPTGEVLFDPGSLTVGGDNTERKSFRIKGNKVGYYHVLYQIQSEYPFPFDGTKQSVIHIKDRFHVTVIQPESGDIPLLVGQRSKVYKILLTGSGGKASVKVVPRAKGIVFEPSQIVFSRLDRKSTQEFRVTVLESAPELYDVQEHQQKFFAQVS